MRSRTQEKLDRLRKCDDVAIVIHAVGRDIAPSSGLKRAQFLRAHLERALMVCPWIFDSEVEFRSWDSRTALRIGELGAQEALDSAFRHEAENSLLIQLKLGHARNMQTGLARKNESVELLTLVLVFYVQDQMRIHGFTRTSTGSMFLQRALHFDHSRYECR